MGQFETSLDRVAAGPCPLVTSQLRLVICSSRCSFRVEIELLLGSIYFDLTIFFWFWIDRGLKSYAPQTYKMIPPKSSNQ